MKISLRRSGCASRAPRTPRHPKLGKLWASYAKHTGSPFIRSFAVRATTRIRSLDLTQGFFALLIEPGALGAVTPAKGKFRSFLMAACTHFLSNQRVYERALKRGGGRGRVSIDQSEAESCMRHEPFHELTPERAFVRQWALTMLDRTMAQLEAEASSKSRSSLFDLVKPAILETGKHASYAEIATELGTTEAVVKVAVHRYRNRFRVLLRQEISRTVDDPADIEEEITTLIQALAN